MKSVTLTFHEDFPGTPVSGWAGARWIGWVKQENASGQPQRPKQVTHPFLEQRKLWCLLQIHFDDVDLSFATPRELDHFVDVLSQNPLPSGGSLVSGQAVGRPNNHWLSRLPAKAKPLKFRKRLCDYLRSSEDVERFRDFYRTEPIRFDFEGVYDSFFEAHQATYR